MAGLSTLSISIYMCNADKHHLAAKMHRPARIIMWQRNGMSLHRQQLGGGVALY